MHLRVNRLLRASCMALVLTLILLPSAPVVVSTAFAQSQSLPDKLTDAEFWNMVQGISEPGGYFQIEDNYTSNEPEIGQLFNMLQARGTKGGVYMGVGPEQNLTYIAAIRPSMAFICDIRRQAVMQHLMFKAMFYLSKDRADFVSILFSKPRPAGLDSTTTMPRMWDAYWDIDADTALLAKNWKRVVDRLTKEQGFVLTTNEMAQLKNVFDAFQYYGPTISTRGTQSGRGGSGSSSSSSFADLTGYWPDGINPRSFMTTEDNFRYVKSLHDRNLIVPVSGDFGGPKAIRAIGQYVREHGATVSAFYVSNVEQYLFQDGKSSAFYANVATLPLTPGSIFIRPYSLRRGTQSLCPIAAFLQAANSGRVGSWNAAQDCPL
jgi:hypothetical protein